MKKFFLASSFENVASLLSDFTGEDLVGKKVVFIPTAGKLEENTFYIDADRKALEELGLIVEDLEVSNVLYDEAKEKINNTAYGFVQLRFLRKLTDVLLVLLATLPRSLYAPFQPQHLTNVV